jgi:hypothetical protein
MYQCTSLTVLEKELEAALRHPVSPPPTPTPAPTPRPTPAALPVGTKLFYKNGAPYGTVKLTTKSAVLVSRVNGEEVTLTREQALAMMQK